MRPDSDIERNVKDELQWRPDLDAIDIAVSVKNGVVTLTGFVHSYVDKYEAEAATKRVAGVVGMANDIEVRLRNIDAKPDPEIAREAVAAIESQLPYSWENIKVIVKDGWVHLEGEEEWQFQRDTAEKAVCRLRGVKGVSNLIKLKPRAQPSEIKRKIQEAFKRNAKLDANRDANRIVVEAKGKRSDPQRHSPLVGRAGGGRACGLVGAGRHQGRKQNRREATDGCGLDRATRTCLPTTTTNGGQP